MINRDMQKDMLMSLLEANDVQLNTPEEIAEVLLDNADDILAILGQFMAED